MRATIITIGDEILIGQVVDTNSTFIAQELGKVGVSVARISSVADESQAILEALEEASERNDLVIVTGGLGPTKDDITKEVFCAFFDDHLVSDKSVEDNIRRLLEQYKLQLPLQVNLRQALVPSKAEVLMNRHGTAPGMWMEKNQVVFIALPGVPFEMRHLMHDEVLPKIVSRFDRPFIYHRTLLTYGMGESALAERISEWEDALPENIKLAYLPAAGKVRLRLGAKGEDSAKLKAEIDSRMENLQTMLSDIAVGLEEETSIVARIGKVLASKNQSLSVAESCTGGRIASEIIELPGVSSFYKGGVVPYETRMKTKILGVPEALIAQYNVVSIEVAEAMAQKCRELFASEYAVATTGIAGPTKGDGDDEIGTVCIAVATPNGVISEKFNFGSDRSRVIERATTKALEMLWKEILKI